MTKGPLANNPVVVMGDIMMDIAIKPHRSVRAASDTESTIRLGVGGAGANTAIHLARLGVDTLLLRRLGDDDLGRLARERLAREGVTVPDVPCSGVATGAIGVLIDPDGQRTMFPQRGANEFLNLAFVREHWPGTGRSVESGSKPDAAVTQVQALFVSGYALFRRQSREAALWAIARAKEVGAPVFIDPASYALIEDVGPQNFLRWIADAVVLLPNRDEATVLATALTGEAGRRHLRVGTQAGAAGTQAGVVGMHAGSAAESGAFVDSADASLAQARHVAQLLAEHFPLVVLTLDKQGAVACQRGEVLHVPAEPVPAVDTTGAGDSFNAGFLAQYVADADLHSAIKAGNGLAARIVQQIGPT